MNGGARLTPVNVSGLTSGVATIYGGGTSTCAITTSGGLKCWGNNADGQVGDGTTTDRTSPVNVSGLTSSVIAADAGLNRACALVVDGTVKCWGAGTTTPTQTSFSTTTTYTYGDSAHKHAVTALSTGESYTYDANGNMTQRVEGGLTYTQTFDAENRLISVTFSGQTTQFVYDGNGNLVKKVKPDGSRTIYVGGLYEVDKNSGGTVTKTTVYYPLADAMRVNGTLYYVLKDHLGSASVVTDTSGNVVGDQRYYPFGATRLATGSMYTDKLFTGQREMAGLGIYHFGARFYSPYINRFLSADTVVPNMANPQDFNRYSYVRNNPVRYIDPSGMVYLRARYYMLDDGRFLTRDTWGGDYNSPLSLNRWNYTEANPINNSDPSGFCIQYNWNDPAGELFSKENCDMLESIYLEASNQYPSTKNLSKMAEWYEKLADAAEQDGNLQSATNIRHFLHGNGTPLRLSEDFMRNQLWNWDYVQDTVNELVNWNIQLNCQLSLNPNGGYARPVVIFPGGLFGNLYTYWLDPPSDVAGALGNFRMDAVISGNIQKNNGLFGAKIASNINVQLTVIDYYNWEKGNNATVKVKGKIHGVPDDWGYVLAQWGFGHNYYIRGDMSIDLFINTRASWFGVESIPPDPWVTSSCIGIGADIPIYSGCAPEIP